MPSAQQRQRSGLLWATGPIKEETRHIDIDCRGRNEFRIEERLALYVAFRAESEGGRSTNEEMKSLLVSLVCLVICGCATQRATDPWPSQTEDDSAWLVSGLVSFIGETQCMTRVTRGDLRRSPDWSPQNGECPVSMESAIALATTWVRAHLPDKKWRFHHLTMQHVIGRKWYYAVSFREERDFEKDNVSSWPIAVLFDGTVNGPERSIVKRDPESGDLQFFEPLK